MVVQLKIMKIYYILCSKLLWFLCFTNSFVTSKTNDCSIPGETGPFQCVELGACAQYVALLKESTTTELGLNLTLERSCGFEGRIIKVCCPIEETPTTDDDDDADFVHDLPMPGTCGRTLFVVDQPEDMKTTEIYNTGDNRLSNETAETNKSLDNEGKLDTMSVYNGRDVNTRVLSQWMALLGYKGEVTWQCGGSIITKKHILTAAHCIRASLFVVRVGELDLEETNSNGGPIDYRVKKMIRHEQYTMYHNDVGLVVVDGTIDYESQDTSWYIGPICLPLPYSLTEEKKLKYTYITGWGETHKGLATHLQVANVTIVDQDVCKEVYGNDTIDEKSFCAGDAENGRDACGGDSGGPLVGIYGDDFHHYQLGIISFGFRCSAHRFMGVYMNVTQHLPWILENVLRKSNSSSS